jgi:uncharacterized protein YkwD
MFPIMCNVISLLDKYPFQEGAPFRQDLPHYNSKMRKSACLAGGILVTLVIVLTLAFPAMAKPQAAPQQSTQEELIAAVNALRAERGLAPYRADPILMSIAQAQAEYLVSIGTVTHTGPGWAMPHTRTRCFPGPFKMPARA